MFLVDVFIFIEFCTEIPVNNVDPVHSVASELGMHCLRMFLK